MTKFDDISGSVAVEMGEMKYLYAMDNGLFKLGEQHDIGQSTTSCVIQLLNLSSCGISCPKHSNSTHIQT